MIAIAMSRIGRLGIAAAALGAASVATGRGQSVAVPIATLVLVAVWLRIRAHQEATRARAEGRLDTLTRLAEVQHRQVEEMRRQVEELRRQVEELRPELAAHERLLGERRRDLHKFRDEAFSHIRANTDRTRLAIRSVRAEIADLANRHDLPPGLAETVATEIAGTPSLSIAVPGFNRPEELRACLESIEAEIERCGTDRVEVWVTDDASSSWEAVRTARTFAEMHPAFGFRRNPENLGLDANLIEACRPCTGEFILIMGNDDLLHPGALDHALADIERATAELIVYGKQRIDSKGDLIDNPARGSTPADAVVGEQRHYEGIIGFAKETGVLSGYGFISNVIMHRERFISVEASHYEGLTLYPHVSRLLEGFADASVLFHNVPLVHHRTTTRAEKLAEAIGRPEESFMAGGDERDMRWLGATFAAALMRVCDRSDLRPVDFVGVPEHLFDQSELIGWIARNIDLAEEAGITVESDIDNDAKRFLRAVDRPSSNTG